MPKEDSRCTAKPQVRRITNDQTSFSCGLVRPHAGESFIVNEDLRDPDRAVDYILANAGKFAAAKAQRVYLEEFRKSKKALLMGQSSAKSAVEREQYAYAHEDYLGLLGGLKAAVEVEEKLKWDLEAARLRVEIWRTRSANNRATDRAMQ